MTTERFRLIAAVIAVVMAVLLLAPVLQADGADGIDVMIDRGNGDVTWSEGSGDTVIAAVADAADGMSVSASGPTVTVDGVSSVTTGSSGTGGSFTVAGTTGATTTAQWTVYGWDGTQWAAVSPDASVSGYSALALGLYPEGSRPAETPDHRGTWTMFRGDADNTGSQDFEVTSTETEDYSTLWYATGASFSNPLYVGGYVIQKFSTYTSGDDKGYAVVSCRDIVTGEEAWRFRFLSGMNYESSTPLIVGDYLYVATMTGYIYRMPWATGPGEDDADVTSFGGSSFADAEAVPNVIVSFDSGYTYDAGFTSMVAYGGAIYASHCNGMVYCFDLGLNLLWSYMMGSSTYFMAPTVHEGIVYASALNGHLYILDAATGSELVDREVYSVDIRGRTYGGTGQVAVFDTGSTYTLIFTVVDGRGMSQTSSGLAVYQFDPSSNALVERYKDTSLGTFGKYVVPVQGDGFTGAYTVVSNAGSTSVIRISVDGDAPETVTEGLAEIHSAGNLVNGRWLYLISYSAANPIYVIDLQTGGIAGTAKCALEVRNFNMSSPLVVGDYLIGGTDSGMYVQEGRFMTYQEPDDSKGSPVILWIGGIALLIILIIVLIGGIVRWRTGADHPYRHMKEAFLHYLYGDDISHNTRSRHRLRFVLIIGGILAFVSFTACICIGSTSTLSPVDAYSALFSAIGKGGHGLDPTETTVYVSRLPRTIAAMAVGIGLAIAGSVYQAIIRNPLVDPYIMGVSSGAGIAAIAVIAFDFTFFGIFSPHSVFLTAVSAMIGGLVAFACTMIIAEKAGGSSINYVLAGVVVGLAFSALQTIMLTMAGSRLSNALTWLYGSFAEVTWSQVGVVLSLSVFLSLVPMIWAKEFNLVLLGEDQAREMGLDVRRFNRAMLILASVLTSVCVAFCGIIGFVGLVIPHLCRMILGSDHRMVLPASFVFGAVMLMLADLLARTGYYGMELPVGAITTVIGIPVFAYLLIKKGRIYDG